MENYREYLPELKTTTIFQDIEDDDLIKLLETLKPKIIRQKAGDELAPGNFSTFKILLRSYPAPKIEPRRFKYDMPKFGEPGFLMGEIPSLSRFIDYLPKPFKPPFTLKPLATDLESLEVSGEMLVKFYSEEVSKAQGQVLRNLLGILSQKVMDVRQELFLLRDGIDLFNPKPEKKS